VKRKMILNGALALAMVSGTALARDDIADYSLEEAFSLAQVKDKLGSNVKFYFGKQAHGEVEKNFGETSTSRKTNAFNKTDKEACQWAFLSAMMALRDKALRDGGNAVVDIQSNYRSHRVANDTTFQCGAGGFVAGVAFVGTVVKLK